MLTLTLLILVGVPALFLAVGFTQLVALPAITKAIAGK